MRPQLSTKMANSCEMAQALVPFGEVVLGGIVVMTENPTQASKRLIGCYPLAAFVIVGLLIGMYGLRTHGDNNYPGILAFAAFIFVVFGILSIPFAFFYWGSAVKSRLAIVTDQQVHLMQSEGISRHPVGIRSSHPLRGLIGPLPATWNAVDAFPGWWISSNRQGDAAFIDMGLTSVAQRQTVAPPGWHPDPRDPFRQRYWDGHEWTVQTRDVVTSPVTPAPQSAGQARALPVSRDVGGEVESLLARRTLSAREPTGERSTTRKVVPKRSTPVNKAAVKQVELTKAAKKKTTTKRVGVKKAGVSKKVR